MRCCVLGGTGFIGQHLVQDLVCRGDDVTVLSRSDADAVRQTNPAFSVDAVQWVKGDWSDPVALAAAVQSVDVCFHLVSTSLPRSSNEDPVADITTNVGGTLRLLEHAVALGVKKVVFVSSGGTIYGTPQFLPISESHPLEPNCSYGIGKLAIEKYLQLFSTLHGLDFGIVRLSNPYGEGQQINRAQGAVSVFLDRVLRGQSIDIWGDGSIVRDYIYVADAVDGILRAAAYRGPEKIFNIGSGTGRSLTDILAEIESLLGCKADVRFLAPRAFDVPVNVLCIERARTLLEFAPKVTFADGIDRTASWQKTQLSLAL
ncbi:UDP-glucose 4-epimerase [Paraburkholderia sp. GAS333]|uniref:NAD-dependent epimerase/dehydratase family protein n=1 Tax=Paraburkholderia sp. GAS333 TaxID=3156279 RepID=UPI003D21A6B6